MFEAKENLNETISTLLSGVAHTVSAGISIADELLPSFEELELVQTTAGHHEFILKLDKDLQNPAKAMEIDLYTRKYLGQKLSITFYYKDLPADNGPKNYFTGIITSVSFEQAHGYHGSIVLKGSSPTILLDDKSAPHIQSFSNKTLQNIINDLLGQGSDAVKRMPAEIQPSYTATIPYSCQYNETHYNYLARLAATYGEWLYYDGVSFHFGKPKKLPEAVKLVYGRDVRQINISTQARHTGNRRFDYDALAHEMMSVSDNKEIEGLDLPGEIALDISNKIFTTESRTPSAPRSDSQYTLDNSEAYQRGATATEVFIVTGITSVPLLHPGCKVELHMQDPHTAKLEPVTTFLITESTHKLDRKNHYSCTFKGIPSQTLHLPEPEFQQPVAAPQLAVVTSNTDPENKGRVQVQFQWQLRASENTHMIRVLSPDAGSSDKISRNRGFVFIPEVGDEVLVGFEYNHPDRPYVMGSMFHGQNGSGGFADNHLKTIKTRSGHSIELDDNAGSWSMTIRDDQGNVILLDTKGKNIEITAPETMTFNCRNMNINVGENMTTSVGMNISENAGMNITTSAGQNIMESATANYTLMAANVLQQAIETFTKEAVNMQKNIKNDIHIISENGSIDKNAKTEIAHNSGEKSMFH